ncbi:MAG: pirin family protein [Bacteroidales bacterium]|nr:pirin family protein [Bacteroidales bacterium]
MKTELHPASERGHANHGWLDSYHSFSFATYFNPAREKFGCLRVLNDDTVAGGTGFDLHPHNNMEIVSIILEGALEHRDSIGNVQVIAPGEVQVMTAGTGIYHAEYNHSETEAVKFFQLWIFPREKGLKPRYDQVLFPGQQKQDQLVTLVTPDNKQEENALWIHQDAYISSINLKKNSVFDYRIRIAGNGVFVFVIDGKIVVDGNSLPARDAMGVSETQSVQIKAIDASKVLFIEIPMR